MSFFVWGLGLIYCGRMKEGFTIMFGCPIFALVTGFAASEVGPLAMLVWGLAVLAMVVAQTVYTYRVADSLNAA
jgi:hypothetical protein